MGNTTATSSATPGHILPPDYFLPSNLDRADVVFAPIGRLGAGRLITSLAYDADNRIIAAGTSTGLVILINNKDFQNTLRLPDGHAVGQLNFLSGCRLFISNGNAIEIWNWETGSRSLYFTVKLTCSAVYENRFVCFGTEGGRIEILDVDHGRLSAYIVHPNIPVIASTNSMSNLTPDQSRQKCRFDALTSSLEVISIALDADILYSAFSSSVIRIYDLRAQEDKSWIRSADKILSMSVEPARFNCKGPPRIAVSSDTGRISFWSHYDQSTCCYLTPIGSGEGVEPILHMEWIASDNLAVLSGDTVHKISVFSLVDCSLLLSFQSDMSRILVILSTPICLVSCNQEGELFLSRFEQAAERCTLIPSNFAQCSVFEYFSGADFLENWISLLDTQQNERSNELCSLFLQEGNYPESANTPHLLITVSEKPTLSFWDVSSPFSARYLSEVNLSRFYQPVPTENDKPVVVSCMSLCPDSAYRIAIGFSNGDVAVIEQNRKDAECFSTLCQIHVHRHRVTLLKLCTNWNRIASADQHSVSLCEIISGQILFAIQLQQASSLFFCQIDNAAQDPGQPLQNILLIGTKKRLLFAYDSISGSCVNSEFAPVVDNSLNDAIDGEEEGSFSIPLSPTSTEFKDRVLICGMVDSHGCAIPIQFSSASKSVYISPRYLIGSWNATLRVCEVICESNGIRINSLCEIRYSHRILQCWLISQKRHEDSSYASAVVTVDAGRRLQIRRLMDIDCILLEVDIPSDLRSEDIPKCSCTRDGRLSWVTDGGEIMTAVLFMDGLRKVHAPLISRIDQVNTTANKRNSIGLLSTIARAIKGSTTAELFSQERIVEESLPEKTIEPETNPLFNITSKAKENLDAVMETVEKSERLSSTAANFAASAKLLAESQKGWL